MKIKVKSIKLDSKSLDPEDHHWQDGCYNISYTPQNLVKFSN